MVDAALQLYCSCWMDKQGQHGLSVYLCISLIAVVGHNQRKQLLGGHSAAAVLQLRSPKRAHGNNNPVNQGVW